MEVELNVIIVKNVTHDIKQISIRILLSTLISNPRGIKRRFSQCQGMLMVNTSIYNYTTKIDKNTCPGNLKQVVTPLIVAETRWFKSP